MEKTGIQNLGGSPALPPPPSDIPAEVKPERVDTAKRAMISRPEFGRTGNRIQLESNHFKVSVNSPDEIFYQYSVLISYKDRTAVENKVIGRKIMDKLYDMYSSELAGKRFAYDGEKALFTVGPLPWNKQEFTVVLEESIAKREIPSREGSPVEPGKRSRRSFYSKSYIVEINFATKIPLKSVLLALNGSETEKAQDALRVLDIILRQQAAKRNCLLVRQSFFHDDIRMFTDIGGGVSACRGLHSSFRPTHGGLSLNIDVSTTMILTPGPVIDFLRVNLGIQNARNIDWLKAKKMLRNMRVMTTHSNREFKIKGLSEKPCNDLYFTLNGKPGDGTHGEVQPEEITVYEYFRRHRNLELTTSAYFPCLDVGKPGKPNYLPLELCSLVSLQRYTKALSSVQRASLVEKSRQMPLERKKVLTESMGKYRYDQDPLLSACGISIEKQLTKFPGRVLNAPMLKVGNGEDCIPCDGRWNFNSKRLVKTISIERWLVVNFSADCDMSRLSEALIKCGRKKGINIEPAYVLIEEERQYRRANPWVRVDKMFDQIKAKLPKPPPYPQLIVCVLPEKKNSSIYGPWKRKFLIDLGISTQCVSPPRNFNDQYLTNVILKINSKLGGINSLLAIEAASRVPVIKDTPTMILGMDVSHGSTGRSDVPSIAAVVGSHTWPLISRYRAAVRIQASKVEMIESLFKPSPNGVDDAGIIRELLNEFENTNRCMPSQIIVFRDGVSESQFNQVLNYELDQIIKAYQYRSGGNVPKFTVIVAQKNHHTKLFEAGSSNKNVPPGTVVDTNIVHPTNFDFYMCSHAGRIGTSRPAHYHVLVDEIGFSADDLQNLVHSLSYVYQRSTTAISIVAPIYYAHLTAAQVGKMMKFDESTDTSSTGYGSHSSGGSVPDHEQPRLHKNIAGSMFFC
ncbi:Argonaute [Heracleum sosnowskyi]|uniref:Argonaute n=1 Tax=Heracleum sosnowskyi TaxID=360622 RepID=A0AAD8ING1_9APIA|nr:Argonaute [Heracleum sosnowskyi]